MGGNAHLVAVARTAGAACAALDAAADRLAGLEARWSRFRPDSEISRLGRSEGHPVPVSDDTRLLVGWCVTAWRRSRGRFDASVGPALERLGYDRTFAAVEGLPAGAPLPPALPAPGCGGIVADHAAGTVTLPAGTRLDPGGLGKGLAADLVTAQMLAAGADGACVNLAGDARVRGAGPDPAEPGWTVGVEHPLSPDRALAVLPLPPSGAAVASSSVLVRRWAGDRHHVIDPAAGTPARSEVAAVTVVAEEGAWADAATKIALVAPDASTALAELDRLDTAALLVLHDGTVLPSAAFRLTPPA